MLKWLEIENFKSIRETVRLRLDRLNLLVGPNSSGKSTILEAVNLAGRTARGLRHTPESGKFDDAATIIPWGSSKGWCRIAMGIGTDGTGHTIQLGCVGQWPPGETEPKKRNEPQGRYLWMVDYPGTVPADKKAIAKAVADGDMYRFDPQDVEPRSRASTALTSTPVPLASNGRNLASVLHRLKRTENEIFRRIDMTLSQALGRKGALECGIGQSSNDYPAMQWKSAAARPRTGDTGLSPGALRFLRLLTLLNDPLSPQLILLDDAETGLHPVAIGLLAETMARTAQERQLLATTRSALLINQVGQCNLLKVIPREDAGVNVVATTPPTD